MIFLNKRDNMVLDQDRTFFMAGRARSYPPNSSR